MNKMIKSESRLLSEATYTYRHESGLTVYITPTSMKTAYAVLSVGYGSVHTEFTDSEGALHKTPAGIAHFLEHKMFEMEGGEDAFEMFAAYGASANAYTSASRTSYLFSCTEHFNESLTVLLRMVFSPYFSEQSVRKEKSIIRQEILSYEDQVAGKLYLGVMGGLYEKHPIRVGICGTTDSIARITPELLYTCYRAFYVPENMVLSIAGDIDPRHVQGMLDSVLAELLPRNAPACASCHIDKDIAKPKVKESEYFMTLARPILEIGIKDCDFPSEKTAMARRHLLVDIALQCAFGADSLLYERLQKTGLLNEAFSLDYSDEPGCAFALLAAESDDPSAVSDAVYAEMERMRRNPPSEADFERHIRCVYADYVRLFDSTEEIAEETLDNFFTGVDLLTVGELIFSLTYGEFTDTVRALFDIENCTKTVVYPHEWKKGRIKK